MKQSKIVTWKDWCLTGIMCGWSWNSMGSDILLNHQRIYNGKTYPGRKDLGGYLLHGLFLIVSRLLVESLQNIVGCSITSDGWSGPSFIGLTIHYIKDWKIFSGCLGLVYVVGSKTSNYLSKVINQTASTYLRMAALLEALLLMEDQILKKHKRLY